MADDDRSGRQFSFRRTDRLSRDADYRATFDARCRKSQGPLTIFTRPRSEEGEARAANHRLGLSVNRRVGTAVARNRIKRRIREAFRLTRHEWPGAYDVVVLVRPHAPLPLTEYKRLMASSMRQAHAEWERRAARRTAQPAASAKSPSPRRGET